MKTSLAKKIFAVGSSAAMLLAAMPFVASAAVHSAGSDVLSNGTVYFINGSGQKQPYTSAGAFLSYGFNSWSNVVPASPEDLALPTGAFVPPMDGSLINDMGTVYLMTNGQRAGFTSAANFLGLGYAWSNVIPGDTSFMTSAPLINSTVMAHPAGTLVNDNGTVYLMSNSGKQGIPSLSVFNSWGYSFSKVVPANSYDHAVAMSNGVMPAMVLGCLSPLNCSGSNPAPVNNGQLNVSLDSSSPASGSVAKGAKVVFSRFNFMAGSSGATISTLVATRIGLSSDSDVQNVYLFNTSSGNQLAVGSINNGRVTFNLGSNAVSVPANGSVVLGVRADMSTTAQGGTTGDSIGYGLASSADAAGASGSFPVNGSLQTIAAVSNLGALTVTSPSTLATTVNSGQTQMPVGYFQFQGSNQPLSISNINFTLVGSVASSNLLNFNLFNGSTQVGSTQQLGSNNVVQYNLSGSPLLIPSGQTVVLWLKADISGGSNRNFQFTIQRTSDVSATDTTYNTGIVPGLATATGTSPVPSSTTNQVTINAGTATLSVDSASPVGNIATGATGVTYGVFDFTAAGEDMLVSALTTTQTTAAITAGSSTDYLTNGKLVDVTNAGAPVQIGSTVNLNASTATGTATTATSTFNIPGYWRVPAGTTRKLAVVADTKANVATAAQLANGGNSITAGITSVTAQGATSLQTVSLGTATGRVLNFVSGALTGALNLALINGTGPSNANGVVGQTGARVGSFTLTAGSAEGANVTQIQIKTGSANGDAARFQNLRINVSGSPVGSTQGVIADQTTYSFTPSSMLSIPAGGSVVVDVYADILSNATTGTFAGAFILQGLTATGSVDNAALTAAGVPTTGQQIDIEAKGTLTVAIDPTTPTTAQVQEEVMGTPQQTLAAFNFAANGVEPINIQQLIVTDTSSAGGDLQNFKLYVNGNQFGPVVPSLNAANNGTATFNMQANPLVVPVNSNVTVLVKADISAFPNATSGDTHILNLAGTSAVTAVGGLSGASITGGNLVGLGSAINANTATVYRAALAFAKDPSSPSGGSSGNSAATVAVLNVSNAANAANQQAFFIPTAAQLGVTGGNAAVLSFNVNSTIVPGTASRCMKVFKASDLTTAILSSCITPTTPTTWQGVWTFGYGQFTANGQTSTAANGAANAMFVPTGAAWAATKYVDAAPTMTAQTINSGATQQYVVQFDTSDAATTKNFTMSLQTQGTNKVWYDGASGISVVNGLPVTFGTLTY